MATASLAGRCDVYGVAISMKMSLSECSSVQDELYYFILSLNDSADHDVLEEHGTSGLSSAQARRSNRE